MLGERASGVPVARATPNADFEAIRARATAGERLGARGEKQNSVGSCPDSATEAAYAAPVALTPEFSCTDR